MKKIIVLVSIMLMVMALAACGKTADTPATSNPASADELALKEEKLVIDDYTVGSVYTYDEYSLLIADSAEAYLRFLNYAEENGWTIVDVSISATRVSNGYTVRYYHVTYITNN